MPEPSEIAEALNTVAQDMSVVSDELDRLLAILRPPSTRENLHVIEGGSLKDADSESH
ncbi:MAG TPA: hypothetical protein VF963_07360 [Gaiellaceae bacterium]